MDNADIYRNDVIDAYAVLYFVYLKCYVYEIDYRTMGEEKIIYIYFNSLTHDITKIPKIDVSFEFDLFS